MYCDVQPESRKGAPDDTAREIEKLFDSLSVFPIHNLNISLLSHLPTSSTKKSFDKAYERSMDSKNGKQRQSLTGCAFPKASSAPLGPLLVSADILPNAMNLLSVSTKVPLWLVFRLSICLRKTSCQRSLQMNLIMSRGVVGRGVLAENLLVGVGISEGEGGWMGGFSGLWW